MSHRHLPLLLIALFLLVVTVFNSMFIVDQTEQALVLQFGQIRRVVATPGLHGKTPFVESVDYFDKRLLDFNAPPTEMITEDKQLNIRERIVVDAYVQYRINDPVQFYKAVGSEAGMQGRFSRILVSSLRSTVGEVSLRELLSSRRTAIMQAVRDEVNKKASNEVVVPGAEAAKAASGEVAAPAESHGFGIEVVDVRIKRADLPPEISESTFKRMQGGLCQRSADFPFARRRAIPQNPLHRRPRAYRAAGNRTQKRGNHPRRGRRRSGPHLCRGLQPRRGFLRFLPQYASLPRSFFEKRHHLRHVAGEPFSALSGKRIANSTI